MKIGDLVVTRYQAENMEAGEVGNWNSGVVVREYDPKPWKLDKLIPNPGPHFVVRWFTGGNYTHESALTVEVVSEGR